jgi:DsbC/DsbD-like thiol-disulfide interchange protein
MKFAAMLVLLAAAPTLFAQGVEVQAVVEGEAQPGQNYTVKLRFTVTEGYHAYHKDNPGYSLPIKVEWKELGGLELLDVTWPEPNKHKDDFSEEWELDGTFDLAYQFKVPEGATGVIGISGRHDTQFCNAEGCLMAEGEFSATIKVAEKTTEPAPEPAPKPAPGPDKPSPTGKKNEPAVTAKAAFEGEAKAGGEATLKLTFEFTKTYHAYHKDNPGYGLAPKVDWKELSGLTLKDTLWPEPLKHDYEGTEEWEYESPLTLTYTFTVPADAKGELPVKAKWDVQVCDENACFLRKGEVAATLTLGAPAADESATDAHGFYLDFNYAVKQSMALNKPLLADFNGEY